ncbi:hypothetical protein DC20_01195 [Rufibacter tibetensis]|uniref:DUF6250 domain-containing protein n=2 Tax=Rufibacter tibetensis TaxID=512763 RepID=A0A0P0C8Z1_9BACT|nr:hypothetical protein DC20_01195 [Rufibacter tibetensis]
MCLLVFSVGCTRNGNLSQNADAAETKEKALYEKGELLYEDKFDTDLKNWIVEAPTTAGSTVTIQDGKLLMDVDGGATIWFNQKLSGDILIEYTRKVLIGSGKNDRLSDLNQFWMATDPRNNNLFTRSGVFSEYDSLLLYYVGFGGNTNSTTRFRKYTGNGERVLYTDLTDKAHLLEPNKEYSIRIVVRDGVTKFYVDNEEYFSFQDPEPLREGYFGFRTVQSRQEADDFRVYRIK